MSDHYLPPLLTARQTERWQDCPPFITSQLQAASGCGFPFKVALYFHVSWYHLNLISPTWHGVGKKEEEEWSQTMHPTLCCLKCSFRITPQEDLRYLRIFTNFLIKISTRSLFWTGWVKLLNSYYIPNFLESDFIFHAKSVRNPKRI